MILLNIRTGSKGSRRGAEQGQQMKPQRGDIIKTNQTLSHMQKRTSRNKKKRKEKEAKGRHSELCALDVDASALHAYLTNRGLRIANHNNTFKNKINTYTYIKSS